MAARKKAAEADAPTIPMERPTRDGGTIAFLVRDLDPDEVAELWDLRDEWQVKIEAWRHWLDANMIAAAAGDMDKLEALRETRPPSSIEGVTARMRQALFAKCVVSVEGYNGVVPYRVQAFCANEALACFMGSPLTPVSSPPPSNASGNESESGQVLDASDDDQIADDMANLLGN